MRLRYLRVRHRPPLDDTAVTFGREEILGLTGSIHFVVGVNGTGKSKMLQTLTETLLTLEKQRIPDFPVTLAYDLQFPGNLAHTILLHCPPSGGEGRLIEFNRVLPDTTAWEMLEDAEGNLLLDMFGVTEWEIFTNQKMPGSGEMPRYLPDVVLVYTSGATESWQRIFAAPPLNDMSILPDLLGEASADQERPQGWLPQVATLTLPDANATIGLWIREEDYRFALLTAVLQQAAREFDNVLRNEAAEREFVERRRLARYERRPLPERYDDNIRSVLDEVGFLWPVTITLRTMASPDDPDWQALAEVATAIIREPENPDSEEGRPFYRFCYDLRSRINENNTARRLLRVLNGIPPDEPITIEESEAKALPALRRLIYWQRRGLTRSSEAHIVLKKQGVHSPIPLTFLSDGERMFLGRMALLYLLWDSQNALMLLDEPETHFNDYWKREIVDILDKSLNERATDVILTTHSSIALTDAFDKEITLLRRDAENPDRIISKHPLPPTFGATPTQVLQEIFEGPRAVGQRSAEFLDTVLVLISFPEEVAASWSGGNIQPTEALRRAIYERFDRDASLDWTPEEQSSAHEQLDDRLKSILATLYDYGRKQGYDEDKLLYKVVEELMEKIGAGFYRFEFRRRMDPILNPPEED